LLESCGHNRVALRALLSLSSSQGRVFFLLETFCPPRGDKRCHYKHDANGDQEAQYDHASASCRTWARTSPAPPGQGLARGSRKLPRMAPISKDGEAGR